MQDQKPERSDRRRPGPAFDYLRQLSLLSTVSFLALVVFLPRLLTAIDGPGWQAVLYFASCAAFLVSILAAQAGMWLEYAGSSEREPEHSGSLEWLLSLLSVWGFMIGMLSLAAFLVPIFLPILRQLVAD
ncbi:hypothetical protein ACFLT5_02570 [Chloroflexota bacterium]